MEINMTTMSSRGQVVIPREMRKNIKTGEKLIILEENNQFIIKRASDVNENFEEDLEFARRTNAILDKYEAGDKSFKTMSSKDFLEKIKTW
jgi:bifunctional DNA-binding transcriptional regulator/antitoxin component of YhaV-PrlF toxin-antitoxin module